MKNIGQYRWDEIPISLKDKIVKAPLEEWGHLPMIVNTEWSTPNFSIIATSDDNDLICFLNLVERTAKFDGVDTEVVGINNLITARKYRGKGFGRTVMDKAQGFIFDKNKIGLLLCGDDVSTFYESLGWVKFSGSLFYNQGAKPVKWHQNTYLFSKESLANDSIDLCGLPW